ncbi:MAG: homoserine dehydrogenase, partial [Pseudomonadales bacterium]
LSEMREKGRSFADVLAEAQALGYAEADPTFDVEGIDAGHKLALLASNAFGIPLDFDKVYCEGITKITTQDVEYAEQLGYRIKHLGMAFRRKQADGSDAIELRVHPTLIPENKLLANVNGVKNAVLVNSHPLGQSLYYGSGAGAGATASAVVADVMDLVRVIAVEGNGHHVPHLGFQPSELVNTRRLHTLDNVGVLADITRILSGLGINIEAILQQPAHKAGQVPVIILTQSVVEQKINQAIAEIEALENITAFALKN